MATELYANSPVTTVSSGGTTAPAQGTSETWTVASSALFPAAATGVSQFHVADPAAPAELIAVTNVSGTTWTVTRGAESTTPVTHLGGFTIWQVVTAADLTGMLVSANNLSDLTSASTARANLGLGAAALLGTPVPVASGGTGQVSQQAALDALAGAQTSAQFLRGNGTHVLMSAIQAADVPTLNQNTTGTAANITGTLDTVPAPAAAVSLNSKKITSLANGSAASDAAAFGQIPVIDATTGDIAAAPGTAAAGATGKAADAGHVHPQPALFAPSGLTGATAASRYCGATTSAAPASGTFAAGDYVIDQTGTIWVCTTAGTPGTWTPLSAVNEAFQQYGYLGWTFDPVAISGGAALGTAGTLQLSKIPWPVTQPVTNIVAVVSAGGTLTAAQCFAGIYNSAGTKLGSTADQSGSWNSAGTTPKTMAISGGPVVVPGGGPGGFIYVALMWNGSVAPSFYKAVNTTAASMNGALPAATLRTAVNSSGNTTSLPTPLTLSGSTAGADLFWAAVS